MKVIYWIAWVLIALAAVIMLLGVIAIIDPRELFLGFKEIVNFFHFANSLLLLAVALLVAVRSSSGKTHNK